MNTFKTYLRILKAKPMAILMYFIIFIVMVSMFTLSQGDTDTTNRRAIRYGIFVDEGGDTQEAKDLIAYLEDTAIVEASYTSEQALRQSVFDANSHFGMVIEKGGTLRAIPQGDPMLTLLGRQRVEEYMQLNRIYTKFEVPDAKEEAKKQLEKETKLELLTTSELDPEVSNMVLFFNFASYTTIMAVFMSMLAVSEVFQRDAFKKRIMISKTPYDRIQRQVLAGHAVIVLLIVLLVIVLAAITAGPRILTRPEVHLMLINYIVYTLCIALIGFLVTRVVKDYRVGNMIANVFGLGTSFLCGVFITMNFLSENVLRFSRLLPTYWYVRANTLAAEHGEGFWQHLMVMALMALVVFVVIFAFDYRQSRVSTES